MTLGEKQREFCRDVGRLISFAYSLPARELTFGDAYRSPEQAAGNAAAGSGIRNSLHTQRLAIDLNLFVDGSYQSDSAAYAQLGEYWKSLNPENAWGGDFRDAQGRSAPDGNHFSRSHEGRK